MSPLSTTSVGHNVCLAHSKTISRKPQRRYLKARNPVARREKVDQNGGGVLPLRGGGTKPVQA